MSDTTTMNPDTSTEPESADAGESSASDTTAANASSDAGTTNGSSDAGTSDASSDAGTANASSDAGTSNASSDAGTSDASSDAGTTNASSDAGTSDAGTSDAGTSDGGTSDAGTAAPVDYKQNVAIPAGINNGLTAVDNAAMIAAFGEPGAKTTDCSAITNTALAKLTVTASVGPFRVTGLKPAVDAITRVFAAVQSAKPDLYALLGTEGMSCVRLVRGSTTSFSNHSWGSAIDLKIGGVLTPRGSTTVTAGLVALAPFFEAERFYWGAGFSTPDGMHFEMSAELLAQWKADGTIP